MLLPNLDALVINKTAGSLYNWCVIGTGCEPTFVPSSGLKIDLTFK